jgi:hypothetical protein
MVPPVPGGPPDGDPPWWAWAVLLSGLGVLVYSAYRVAAGG